MEDNFDYLTRPSESSVKRSSSSLSPEMSPKMGQKNQLRAVS